MQFFINDPNTVNSILTQVGVVATAFLTYKGVTYKDRQAKKEKEKEKDRIINELQMEGVIQKTIVTDLHKKVNRITETVVINGERHVLPVYYFLFKCDNIKLYCNELMKYSNIDRISFFLGTNGSTEMKVVYLPLQFLDENVPQSAISKKAADNYNGIETDPQYRSIIKRLPTVEYIDYEVEKGANLSITDSGQVLSPMLTKFYRHEGVLISRIAYFHKEVSGDNVGWYYLSLATRKVNKWTETDIYHMEIFIRKIRMFFNNWIHIEVGDNPKD